MFLNFSNIIHNLQILHTERIYRKNLTNKFLIESKIKSHQNPNEIKNPVKHSNRIQNPNRIKSDIHHLDRDINLTLKLLLCLDIY